MCNTTIALKGMFYLIVMIQITAATITGVEMLKIYHWDFFIISCFSTKVRVSLYQKRLQFSCHLITGRNVKDLPLENVLHHIASV